MGALFLPSKIKDKKKNRMKNSATLRIAGLSLFLWAFALVAGATESKKEESGNYPARQILIVGLHDNVKSNYFYKGLIAEETGMQADSIDSAYNRIIAENIAATASKRGIRFIPATGRQIDGQVLNEIRVNGESEDSYADLSAVPAGEWQKALDKAGADYLLVLNQHYLKWQDQPFRTLFHIVSYTLFDKEKKEICRGNNYFTCMNLENPDKLRKISRKSSSKIASAIVKTLDQE